MTLPQILFVDDEKSVLSALQRLFLNDDYEIITAESGQEGLDILAEKSSIKLVISDYRMPGMNGIDFLRQVWTRWPATVRLVLSGTPDAAAAVGAINEGQIYKFVTKPWNGNELRATVALALQVHSLKEKNEKLVNDLLLSHTGDRSLSVNQENMPQEFFQKILAELPVAVLCLDDDLKIVQSNHAADTLLAGADSSLLGLSAAALPAEINAFLGEAGAQATMDYQCKGKHTVKVQKLHIGDGREGTVLVLLPKE